MQQKLVLLPGSQPILRVRDQLQSPVPRVQSQWLALELLEPLEWISGTESRRLALVQHGKISKARDHPPAPYSVVLQLTM